MRSRRRMATRWLWWTSRSRNQIQPSQLTRTQFWCHLHSEWRQMHTSVCLWALSLLLKHLRSSCLTLVTTYGSSTSVELTTARTIHIQTRTQSSGTSASMRSQGLIWRRRLTMSTPGLVKGRPCMVFKQVPRPCLLLWQLSMTTLSRELTKLFCKVLARSSTALLLSGSMQNLKKKSTELASTRLEVQHGTWLLERSASCLVSKSSETWH